MKVLIIDQHILFRQGLASLLNNEPDFKVIGEADNAKITSEYVVSLEPDLIIIDAALPDNTGFELLRTISACCPATKIVILTAQDSDELLFEAIRAGAKGYLLKNTPITKILVALRATDRGESALSRAMTTRVLDEFKRMSNLPGSTTSYLEMLTRREIEILAKLEKGASNDEIARSLLISKNTVKVHVHNIISKLNLRSRREAGLLARNLHLSGSNLVSPQRSIENNRIGTNGFES